MNEYDALAAEQPGNDLAPQRLRDLRLAGVGTAHDFAAVDGTDGDEFLRHGDPVHAWRKDEAAAFR